VPQKHILIFLNIINSNLNKFKVSIPLTDKLYYIVLFEIYVTKTVLLVSFIALSIASC